MTQLSKCFTFFLSTLILGCQSAKELHYFKADDNYYRLRIHESSFASKSRYLSGYFDEKAVDKYFSEMSQPHDSTNIKWVGSQSTNGQLIMILSTNSNSVAEQIGNLASNEELLETVALLANKDKFNQIQVTSSQAQDIKKLAEDIRITGDKYFLAANDTTIRTNIKDFLQKIILSTKSKLTLENAATALSNYK